MPLDHRLIRVRIIFISILCSLVLGAGISAVAIRAAGQSSIRHRTAQLVAVREGVRNHVEETMARLGDVLAARAASPDVAAALADFSDAFPRIPEEVPVDPVLCRVQLIDFYSARYFDSEDEGRRERKGGRSPEDYLPDTHAGLIAHYYYIARNPHPEDRRDELVVPEAIRFAYADAHARYHPGFRTFRRRLGFRDILLAGPDGRVLYSVRKEIDFATRIDIGPAGLDLRGFQNFGNLGGLIRDAAALPAGEIAFADFAPYPAAGDIPAAFLATPIFADGDRVGVLIARISLDTINAILPSGADDGGSLGQTGVCYLVGPDGRMRGDGRPMPDGASSERGRLAAVDGRVAAEAVVAAVAGRSGTGIIRDHRNLPLLVAHGPVSIFDTRWAAVAQMDRSEVLEDQRSLIGWIILVMVIGVGAVLGILIPLIRRILVRPLAAITDTTRELSEQGGDLTREIPVRAQDELGILAGHVNRFIGTLRTQMLDVQTTTEVMNGAVRDLSNASRRIETTANGQAAAVKEVVSTMEDADALSKRVAVRVQEVAELADGTRGQVGHGFTLTRNNREKMTEIRDANRDVGAGIRAVGEHVRNIWEIIEIINAVADQTRIIAFNAELEASAAGERGESFEIVANEIRRLANHTVDATRRIKGRIDEIQKSADALALTAEAGTKRIAEGEKVSARLETVFGEIQSSADSSAESARTITDSITQQVAAFEQILLTLKDISSGIDSFVISTRATSRAAETLQAMAGELDGIVGGYEISG